MRWMSCARRRLLFIAELDAHNSRVLAKWSRRSPIRGVSIRNKRYLFSRRTIEAFARASEACSHSDRLHSRVDSKSNSCYHFHWEHAMITRRLPVLYLAVILATGSLRLVVQAQVATMAGSATGEGFVNLAIQHRNELNLKTTQVDALEAIRTQLRKDSIQKESELRIAEIELSELQRDEPVNPAKIEAKLTQIASLTAQLQFLGISASEKVKTTLNPKQRSKLKTWDSNVGPPIRQSDAAASDIQSRVLANLKDQFKGQDAVEIETTQAVVARLLEWAKYLAFIVGVPLALLGFGLGFLGIRTYSDFSALVKKGKEDLTQSLEEAQTRVATMKGDADSLNKNLQTLKNQVADMNKLADDVKDLSIKVDRIEEKVGFTSSSKLTPKLKKQVISKLHQFQAYLQNVGFQPEGGKIDIDVPEKMQFEGLISHYDPTTNRLVINKEYASDSDLSYHEYMRRVLYPKSDFPSLPENEIWTYLAINSGLCAYFTCSFKDNPRLAEKTASLSKLQINLNNHRNFSDIKPGPYSAQTDGKEVWGGAFWELRGLIGQAVTDNLLFRAWFALRAEDVHRDLGVSFLEKLLDLARSVEQGKYAEQIRQVFSERGLK